MKEYTIIAIFSVFAALILDKILKTSIFKKAIFYFFLIIIIFFKFLVNGYLTGKLIVIYNPQYYLGVRIGSIPIEDFLFGFSMVVITITFWEYFKGKVKT